MMMPTTTFLLEKIGTPSRTVGALISFPNDERGKRKTYVIEFSCMFMRRLGLGTGQGISGSCACVYQTLGKPGSSRCNQPVEVP